MTTFETAVKNICDEIYINDVWQITIDLIQEVIEELVGKPGVTREDIGAAAYETDILLEVFNPEFVRDIDILTRLYKALNDWSNDIEATNILLGLPKES